MNPLPIVAFGDSITRGYGVAAGAGWVELLPALRGCEESPGNAGVSPAQSSCTGVGPCHPTVGNAGVSPAQSSCTGVGPCHPTVSSQPLRPGSAVHNAGGNGNTSREGLARFPRDVLPHLPAVVLIEFGGNDAVHEAGRGVGVEEFAANLVEMHRLVTTAGGSVVLTTFPPIINTWHAFHADPYYATWGGLDQCVADYRQRTRVLAGQLGCPLFDLDQLIRERLPAEQGHLIASDGIHLTVAGNALVAEAMAAFLAGLP